MTIKEKNQLIYNYAKEYLISILPTELHEKDLEKYFIGDKSNFSTLQEVFEQLIYSAQNYQSMPNVIKYELRKNEIKEILYDYDFYEISKMNVENLYYDFRNKFNIISKDSKMNCWYKWSKSIIDAAKIMSNFSNVQDFKNFVSLFNYNTVTRMSLPLLISSKVSGIGFALACDFLKELGYLDYPKPDVHIIEIFSSLELSDSNPINVFEAVIRMSDACKEIDETATPYKIDKILWLISSGRFYLDGDITVGRHRDEFIKEINNLIY